MAQRFFAQVAHGATPKTKHMRAFIGPGGKLLGEPMGVARIVILEPSDGGWALVRYDRHGDFAGDTWHETYEEALHQTRFEFGRSAGDRILIPAEITDTEVFATQQLVGDQTNQ